MKRDERVPEGRPWREFWITAVLALTVCGGVQFLFRQTIWKLADTTLVLADWPGFLETALETPFGAVDWVARLLCAANLLPGGWIFTTALLALTMVVLFAVRGMRPAAAAWLPAFLLILPLVNLGDWVWLLTSPHFIQWNLLWLILLAAVLALAGWKGLAGLSLAVLLTVVGMHVHTDVPFGEILSLGFGFFPTLWHFSCCTVAYGVFAAVILLSVLHVRKGGRLLRFGLPALLAFLAFAMRAPRDTRDQLEMERLVRERRFAEVLEVAPEKRRPERMETAWRILAMYRTDRLDRDLFSYPIVESHKTTLEEETIMEGPLLLFEYGLIHPSRRWLFECLSVKGWQPDYFRLLGEGAVITGERELAKRNFRQLARCPFRGDGAARRLAALETGAPHMREFDDLADLTGMYYVWRDKAAEGCPYFNDDRVTERFVYAQFLTLGSCPPPMLKMLFASALLDGDRQMLRNNRKAMEQLYGNGPIGPVFLEALR